MPIKKIKDSDSTQVLVDFLHSTPNCEDSVAFFEGYRHLTIKETITKMTKTDNIHLQGWLCSWLQKYYMVPTKTSRIKLIKYAAGGEDFVGLLKIYRLHKKELSPKEVKVFKDILVGKLPNILKGTEEFDG